MPTYNGEKHVELEGQRTTLQNQIQEVSERMNTEYESDAWEGEDAPAKMARYNADNIRHAQLSRELSHVEGLIREQENLRPMSRAERGANPMLDITRRWCMGGSRMLDEGERQQFIVNVDDETRNALMQLGGEGTDVFDPWAIATEGGKVRMAGPSRSDSGASGDQNLHEAAPETWAAGVVESLKYYGAVAANCHNFDSDNGNDLHLNGLDTKDEMGGEISDQSSTAGTGVPPTAIDNIGAASKITFKSSWRHSNFLDARIETFQDIHFDMAGRIMAEMSRRLGRGWNYTFTRGGSVAEGILQTAQVVDGGSGSTGAIDYNNLLDMEYSIDLAYLAGSEGGAGGFMDAHGGMIGWMMHRNVEKQLRFAVFPGSNGLPIWVPDPTNVGIATQRSPGKILGWNYSINNAMGDGGTATKFVDATPADRVYPALLFGACGHFAVRNIGGPLYYRFFDSNTVSAMSVRFFGLSRRDSRSRGPTAGSAISTANDFRNGHAPNDGYSMLQQKD